MFDFSKLNYSALGGKEANHDELIMTPRSWIKRNWIWLLIGIMIGGFVLRIVVSVVFQDGVIDDPISLAMFSVFRGLAVLTQFSLIVPLIIFVVPVIIILSVMLRRDKIAQTKLKEFAKENDLVFTEKIYQVNESGVIFRGGGHSGKMTDVVDFDENCRFGKYEYSTGSGEDEHIHEETFLRIKLSGKMPHIIIDSRKNSDTLRGISSLDADRLRLEGNFPDTFRVYTVKNRQIDVLSILTPDVMRDLLDFGNGYDFELVDNELYVYPGKVKIENLQKFLMRIQRIAKQLEYQVGGHRVVTVGAQKENVSENERNNSTFAGRMRGRRGMSGIFEKIIIGFVGGVVVYSILFAVLSSVFGWVGETEIAVASVFGFGLVGALVTMALTTR